MFIRSGILCLVMVLAVANDETTANEPSTTQTVINKIDNNRGENLKKELLEKALFAKKRKKDNFDHFNLRYLLNNPPQDEPRRSNNYHHRNREYLARKSKKHRTMLPPLKERKPNIVLILTDDQDVELGSLNFMPRTLRLLRDGGAEFRHAYVTTPMCCPSRSSLLTGMYVHNHNVFTNNENCSSLNWQRTHETRTFATYLSNAGYRTGYFGKYLNKYNGSYVPAGWREWGGLIMNSRYYNYSINLNGRRVRHGADYERDYYTDLIANDSVSFLRQSKQYFSRKPVMLVASFPAPHGPEDSAPQFSNMFFNVTTHHTPAYDYAPNPDKQWILQVTNRMQGIHKQFTDLLMTKRLQTLQSVDIAVERIYQELKHIGELDNTYIVYTSDHGYHLGQFGLVKGKSFPFEFDVRVPFLVRGPGIQPGTVVEDIVLNLDLAPTFLDMAGVETPPHMDGRSIMKLLHPPRGGRRPRWPDTFLIESSGRRDPPDLLKLKGRHKVADATTQDPSQNVTEGSGADMLEESGEMDLTDDEEEGIIVPEMTDPAVVSILHDDLSHDNKIPGIPKPALAASAIDCLRLEYQEMCRVGQKWFCIHDGVRWRKHKCRWQTCACFTQQGEMYTRSPQPGDEIRMDDALLHVLNSRRRKRDADDDHIADIVDDLDAELEEAQETNVALRNSTLWQCSVTTQGVVNCSDVVYSDYKTWKQTRDRADAKIRLLKAQLTALKELRRHLKEKRPQHGSNETLNGETIMPEESFGTTLGGIETVTSTPALTETPTSPQPTEALETTTETKEDAWINRIDRGPVQTNQDTCFCSPVSQGIPRREDAAKEAKRRLKEEKMRKKERKSRKKAKMEKDCLSEKMNCFNHDNEHWRTPPFWTEGPFCFCMNANNNTYSCLRTINTTHNFLYCEFVTGLTTFYNIRIDPFEQMNRISSLSAEDKKQLALQLEELRSCRGTKECTLGGFTRRHWSI